MSGAELTELERQYLECETPMLGAGKATARITMGVFSSLLQATFMPGTSYGKADRGLMKTIREIKYTKYKKAVLRKSNGQSTAKDKKTLEKLNKTYFILEPDTYDADEYTRRVYEDYMASHKDE